MKLKMCYLLLFVTVQKWSPKCKHKNKLNKKTGKTLKNK